MHDGATKVLAEDEPTFLDDPCYSSAVFSPDGRYVAASHRDGVVRIWDGRTGQLMRRVKMHMDRANAVAFLPDGNGLVSGGWDPALKYMDIGSLYDTQLRSRSQTINDSQRGDAGPEEEIRHEQQFLGHKVRRFNCDSYNSIVSCYRMLSAPLPFRLMADGLPPALLITAFASGTRAMRQCNASLAMKTGYIQ